MILEKHPQRKGNKIFGMIKDFLNIYCDLEEEEFKLMNLTSHITSED